MNSRAFALAVVSTAFVARAAGLKAAFDAQSQEVRWPLSQVAAEMPSDWTQYKFLTLELKSSTAHRFDLRIYTTNGLRQVHLLPFEGAWIRASVPLGYLESPDQEGHDLASLGNKSRVSYWLNLTSDLGPLTGIEALGIAMPHPVGRQTVEIRSLKLEKESSGDAVLETKPLVDEFGQWIGEDWPGKARTLDELKAAWTKEDAKLRGSESNPCKFGGFQGAQARATGFFRVEKIDGRWWFVDPDRHLFFSTGADCMTPYSGTRMDGRDGVFTALPPADLRALPQRFRRPNRSPMASFLTWNIQRRFGTNWTVGWEDLCIRRMENWGLNTIACWSDQRLWNIQRKPYVVLLPGWGIEGGFLGLPDVFSEEFARNADVVAREQCAPRKDDPWLLGYFVGNEPPWAGRELQIAQAILNGPTNAMRRELQSFLAGGDTRQRRKTFVYHAVGKLFDTVNAAIKKHDPNHLNLGIRFGFRPPDELMKAARGFDVYSLNSYQFEPDPRHLELAAQLTERPLLIGEFHFGAPERGLAPSLVQTRNQEERGAAYRFYVEHAAANPSVIGVHWFQWADEPNTGRMDGENYNCGMIDVTDRPYAELVEAMKTTHERLLAVHSGKEAPVGRRAAVE